MLNSVCGGLPWPERAGGAHVRLTDAGTQLLNKDRNAIGHMNMQW